MALRITIGGTGVFLIGDGVTTEIVVDFEKPPFNFNFKGNYPIAAEAAAQAPTYTVTLIRDAVVKIVYDVPLAAGQQNEANFYFFFAGTHG